MPLAFTVFFWVLLSGVVLFTTSWTHTLTTLISLEFMSLAMFCMLTVYSLSTITELFTSFLFIAITVCEGTLGLSVVVVFSRAKGNELLKSSSSLLW